MDYKIKIAARMLTSRRGSLMGAIFAIAIGILVVSLISVIFTGLGNAFVRDFTDYQFGHLVVRDQSTNIERSENYLMNWFKKMPSVDAAAPRLQSSGDIEYRKNGQLIEEFRVQLVGIDPLKDPTVSKLYLNIEHGIFVTDRSSVVIGAIMAEKLNVNLNERIKIILIDKFGDEQEKYFTVTGIGKRSGGMAFDTGIILHIDTLRDMTNRQNETGQILVRFNDISNIRDVQTLFLMQFHVDDLTAEIVEVAAQEQLEGFNAVLVMFTLIGYVGMLSSAFAIVTIQMMLVARKTRDVGVIRAIGAKRRDILIIFLVQGMIIGLLGVAVGTAFGLGFATYAKETQLSFMDSFALEVEYDWMNFATTGMIAFTLVLISSIYPAYRATKLQPLEAIRNG